MRAVFFGTPPIAVPALQALASVAEVLGVVTQPDRPAGRGLRLQPPAVKLAAAELGLAIYQPTKVRDGALRDFLLEHKPDLALVIAYGRILPPDVLDAPRLGCVNLHASLLPRYRGAAPIQRAIIAGEPETGISLMQMDEGMDTGPVFSRHVLSIGGEETAGELAERLGRLAGDVVRADLPRLVGGELTAEPQRHELATHAPPIEREDCRIDWTLPSARILARVRGLAPRPAAFTTLGGKQLRVTKLCRCRTPLTLGPGEVGIDAGRAFVGTGDDPVELLSGQLEGKRELSARDLVNGRALNEGCVLGS
jgi:methionyl-tRNA formyltransferase